jgi:serine/threonine-protein kinase RsbW
LADVLDWFDKLYQPEISQEFWLQLRIALAEGFTNAVRHAHKGKSQDVPIDLEIDLLPEYLELRIWDQGPPFDLCSFLKNQPPKEDLYTDGGWGLPLMQRIANFLNYIRTPDNRNCLVLKKYYDNLMAVTGDSATIV